jgi:hypothetical protein
LKAELILKSVLLGLLIAGTFNLSWQIYREVQDASARERLYQEYGFIACKLGPATDESSRLLIELGLILAYVGCSLGRRVGKPASLLGLLFAAGVYLLWWRYYFVLMEASEADEAAVDHLFYLYRGVWPDLCVAAFLPMLIAWQALTLALPSVARRKYS